MESLSSMRSMYVQKKYEDMRPTARFVEVREQSIKYQEQCTIDSHNRREADISGQSSFLKPM